MVDMAYTEREDSKSHNKGVFSGSMAESLAGMGAIALAIIGLSNVYPALLASIAILAIGVALAFEGGSVSARYSALAKEGTTTKDMAARWGGVTALFLAGAIGIALGILSLVGLVPMVLIPVAGIVFGSALMMDSGANERLSVLEARHSEDFNASEDAIRKTARFSAGTQVLVGIGSVTLGILALVGIAPMVLSLITMLSIGAASLLTGALIGGRLTALFSSK
jgi:hypothetical protein